MTDLRKFLPIDYDITDELVIRKILEKHSPYTFEFIKNQDKYGCDLLVHIYRKVDNEWERLPIGMVELERALNWTEYDIPPNWFCISLLKRKLFDFDYQNDMYTKEKKYPNGSVFYLKFNKSYTNCFCQSIDLIIEKGEESKRNDIERYGVRKGSYWQIEKEEVVFGIPESIDYICKDLIKCK
jgi:hypothetical protein